MNQRGFLSRPQIAGVVDNIKSLSPPGGHNPQGGKTYFVNADIGSNNNLGTDPDYPLADIEAAYLKCVNNKGDYIFAQRVWALTAPPLTIAKRRIHIIGMDHNPGGIFCGNGLIGDAAISVVFGGGAWPLPAAHGTELAGFALGSPDAAQAAVEVTADVSGCHIHHCAIGQSGSGATYGIRSIPGGSLSDGWVIDHCEFGTGLTEHHIDVIAWTGRIADNIFRNPAAAKECIALAIDGDIEIFGNMFVAAIGAGPVAGWAVHLGPDVLRCFVYHNWAARAAQAADATNPFRDESTAGVITSLNAWADNFDGMALSAGPDA